MTSRWAQKGHDWRLHLSGKTPTGPEKPPGRGRGGVRSIFRYDKRTNTRDLHASTHKGSADCKRFVSPADLQISLIVIARANPPALPGGRNLRCMFVIHPRKFEM